MKLYKLLTSALLTLVVATGAFAMDIEEKLTLLKNLYESNLSYNETLPVDSVIEWGEEIEDFLEKENRNRELYAVKHLVTRGYCARRDIGLALDKVRLMFQWAQKNNDLFGVAITYMAAGDTYAHSNLLHEAISSYRKSKDFFTIINETGTCKKMLLIELSHTLLAIGESSEALLYLKKMEDLLSGDDDPLNFVYLYHRAYYNIGAGELTLAKELLEGAKKIAIEQKKGEISKIPLCFVYGKYYQKEKQYNRALDEYNQIDAGIMERLDPIKYAELTHEKGALLEKMGRTEEACMLYLQMNELKDSLNTKSIVRQLNELRADYRISKMEIENQTHKSQLLRSILLFITILLFISIVLIIYFRRSNKKLIATRLQLKKAKEDVEQSVRSKSLFLSNMSHEIRTPLNALTGFSAILTEDLIDVDTRKQCNDIIQQNSKLLLKLIDDVIDLSSMEFGKMQFNFKENDVVTICRNVVDMVDKIKQTQAEVEFECTFEEFTLFTDEARLQQVLINLLINATKFTLSGAIVLELKEYDANNLLFMVTDTGCGIPLENQARIFDRFEKVNEAKQGTGLGLSICQLIINHIGGKIWIDSSYTEGTRFCFTHPINTGKDKL